MAEPISLEQLERKLNDLKGEMDAGKLKTSEYDQRLARIIQEMRDRKLDADRTQINAKLNDLLKRGVITPSVKSHLEKRLGVTN